MTKEFDFKQEFEKMMESRKLETVVILGHINPDGDAAGSVLGIAHYIKANYPQYKVYPYLAETLDKGPGKIVKTDKIFRPFIAPDVEEKRYAVIVCDNAVIARMAGKEYYENAEASMVIDHHASNEGYGDINYTKISDACAENVFYILDEKGLQKAAMEEHPNATDYIYLGIVQDTGGFARAKESTFLAAAKLQKMGVEHSYIMQTMHNDTLESMQKKAMLLNMIQRAFDGKVAYVCVNCEEGQKKQIGYEDIHPIGEILRDCEDVEMSFTMFEELPNAWRCSFRSDGKWVNVNELLTPFGGGGHAAAAGLKKKTADIEALIADIFARVKTLRAER